MHACDLRFPAYDAAARHAQIRWALFEHAGVHHVLQTPHADTLRVVHRGPVDAAGWSATLIAAGFPAPQVDLASAAPLSRPREQRI